VIEFVGPTAWALVGSGGVLLIAGFGKVKARAELSLAKHRSLAGHPRTARRFASLLPAYAYDEAQALGVDGAPPELVARRKAALDALIRQFQSRFSRSLEESAHVAKGLSDMQL